MVKAQPKLANHKTISRSLNIHMQLLIVAAAIAIENSWVPAPNCWDTVPIADASFLTVLGMICQGERSSFESFDGQHWATNCTINSKVDRESNRQQHQQSQTCIWQQPAKQQTAAARRHQQKECQHCGSELALSRLQSSSNKHHWQLWRCHLANSFAFAVRFPIADVWTVHSRLQWKFGHKKQNHVGTWQSLEEESYILAIALNESLKVTHSTLELIKEWSENITLNLQQPMGRTYQSHHLRKGMVLRTTSISFLSCAWPA